MNGRYRIAEWFRRLEETDARMTREDVCFLMVQVRHLIEASTDPTQYRVADFYTDWTVHTALDRAPVCFEMLRDIHCILAKNTNPTAADLPTQISQVIGLPKLRAELIALFRAADLPITLFEYRENWRGFVTFLLWFLAGQPIGFPTAPNRRAAAIRDEMRAHPMPKSLTVEALAIVDHEGAYHWQLGLTGEVTITMMGKIDLVEGQDVFTEAPALA